MLLSYAIFPVTLLVGMKPLAETTTTHNWDQIATTVRAYQAEHDADFFAANRYQLSSPLAFALDDPDVAELSPRRTAFDDWFDYDARRGQSAIVLVERRDDTSYWRTLFTTVTPLGAVDVVKFGRKLHGYEAFLGEGFLGQP
jgi:hypothetical protein